MATVSTPCAAPPAADPEPADVISREIRAEIPAKATEYGTSAHCEIRSNKMAAALLRLASSPSSSGIGIDPRSAKAERVKLRGKH